VWLPSGCKAHQDQFSAQQHWIPDKLGDAKLRSRDSKAACDARKSAFDEYCGVTDAVMLHMPSSTQNVSSQDVPQVAAVDGASLQTDAGSPKAAEPSQRANGSSEDAEAAVQVPSGVSRTEAESQPPFPNSSGCFVWLPSGCKAHQDQFSAQ
jgi:hypothetical protein